jgi:sterol desaturase/sphingolipid hydroxylase (fatty acid hydroxylase superfamily)
MTDGSQLLATLVADFKAVATIFVVAAYVRLLERRRPIDAALSLSNRSVVADWKLVGVNVGLTTVLGPLAAMCGAVIINAAGGGLITLPSTGLWYPVSLLGLLLIVDLYKYWHHRLKHSIPILWEMHSFHHSADALTWATGARHYWLEGFLDTALLPVIPILFRAPHSMVWAIGVIYFFPDTCAHANVRIQLGRFVTWIGNPQWHRIHHSAQPEHFDKNFSALLPLWDILFGTAWIPHPDEYPATGMGLRGEKISLLDGVAWPFRGLLRTRSLGANHIPIESCESR